MAAKRNLYTGAELEWAENQLLTWKAYIDAHPLHELKDRIEWKPTSKGGMLPMVIASIEQQGKFIQDTLKNYLALIEVVERLREEESKKVESRGGKDISTLAEEFLNKGKNA